MSKFTKLGLKELQANPNKLVVFDEICDKHIVVSTFAQWEKNSNHACPVCAALKTIKTKSAFQKYCDKVMPNYFEVKEFNGIDKPVKIVARDDGCEVAEINGKSTKDGSVTPRIFIDENHYPMVSEKRWSAELAAL